MDKKKYLIEKITKFDNKYFNEDQKKIAISILENSPEEEVQAYANFIFMKRRTGFAFDYSPEIAKGRLITLKEDVKKRINVNDDINGDENKLIIGDNYNALKSLLVTHKEKIDVIYIDPPYNTESAKTDGNQSSKEGESSKFIYKDKFGRGGWLNMMRARLTLAKDLLSADGVIFVSIDDSEQAYLKVLMDDIFGEDNFIGCFIRDLGKDGQKTVKTINTKHEYVLAFTKNVNIEFLGTLVNSDAYNLGDEFESSRGKYHDKLTLDASGLRYSKSLDYLITAPDGSKIAAGSSKKTNEERTELRNNRINGNASKADWQWRWNETAFLEALKKGYFYFKKTNNGWQVKQKHYLKSAFDPKTLKEYIVDRKQFLRSILETATKEGSDMIKSLGLIFPNPKPISLISKLLSQFDKNILVLDFFAGSGTTGQAVMELNRQDNGNRKFILCTNNENEIADKITYERLHRVIKGETSEGKNDFNWIKNNKPYSNEKLRVIKINDEIKISLDQDIDSTIYKKAKDGLKLLDAKYNKENLNLYYDLAALNPLENDEEKI